MRVVDFAVSKFSQRIKSLPRLRYWLIAAALIPVGMWVRSIGGLEGLHTLCDQLVHDLGLIQPLGFIGIYYDNLGPALNDFEGWPGPALLLVPFWAWYGTVLDLWAATDLPGHILIPLALLAGIVPAYSISKRVVGDEGIALVLTPIVTPIVAGLLAWGLQLVLIAVFWIFGQVIGLVVLFLAATKGLWDLWRFLTGLKGSAEKLEGATAAMTSVAAVTVMPPHDDPDPHSS